MLPDPPRAKGPWGLRQIYPPVTLKYPLMQKLIETPGILLLLESTAWLVYTTDQPGERLCKR